MRHMIGSYYQTPKIAQQIQKNQLQQSAAEHAKNMKEENTTVPERYVASPKTGHAETPKAANM